MRAPYDARTGPRSVRTRSTPTSWPRTQPTSGSRPVARAAVNDRSPFLAAPACRECTTPGRAHASDLSVGRLAARSRVVAPRTWVVGLRRPLLLGSRRGSPFQRLPPGQDVFELEPLDPLEARCRQLLLRPDLVEGGVERGTDQDGDREEVEPQQHRDRGSQRAVDGGGVLRRTHEDVAEQ